MIFRFIQIFIREDEFNIIDHTKYIRIRINKVNKFFSNDTSYISFNHIKENTPDKAVVFITGIGKCYPILRSHTVLNNLHQDIDNVPVVLFYPGNYDGQELVLFGEIKDDNYYRAFKLVD